MGFERFRPAWLTDQVAMFQETARRFFAREFVPHLEMWREQGCIDRALWRKAGNAGLLAASLPETWGGGGSPALMATVLLEQGRIGDAAWGIGVQNYVCHYILAYGTPEQQEKWLPRLASGDLVAAIAMTEPSAGSDLKNITTAARREEDHYALTGQKTFISNGLTANLICVVAKTNPLAGAKGISLLMFETDGVEGFRRGRRLRKIGLHAADTSELFFDNVAVPSGNLLGGVEGQGFGQLMSQLPWERLSIAVRCVGLGDFALEQTVAYVRRRKAFGATLFELQNTQFKLAEMKTKLEAMRSFIFDCIGRHQIGELDPSTAAMAKLFSTQALSEIVDECVQLHGGYGFMDEYPIARLYCDVRAQKIYGGSNEVMKLLVARHLEHGA
jgi:acyl-CoA dehydrogenase